jgi:hypothetical protein
MLGFSSSELGMGRPRAGSFFVFLTGGSPYREAIGFCFSMAAGARGRSRSWVALRLRGGGAAAGGTLVGGTAGGGGAVVAGASDRWGGAVAAGASDQGRGEGDLERPSVSRRLQRACVDPATQRGPILINSEKT